MPGLVGHHLLGVLCGHSQEQRQGHPQLPGLALRQDQEQERGGGGEAEAVPQEAITG